MSPGPALVMNTTGERTEGLFLTSSFPWIGLQISTLPLQFWKEPIQQAHSVRGEEAEVSWAGGASCINSDVVSDRATQRWVLRRLTGFHSSGLLEEKRRLIVQVITAGGLLQAC